MRIALLGGTGDVGRGLALRWGHDTDHEILLGSREAERAQTSAGEYLAELSDRGVSAEISGHANATAADRAGVVVLAVPPHHVADTVAAVGEGLAAGDLLVSPAAGIRRDDAGFHHRPPDAGSVTVLAAEAAPEGVPVVGAFHNLAAGRLADLDADLGIDTLVVGDDEDATATVARLAEEIDGLRALEAGPAVNAAEVEALTPLLINVASHNEGMHDLGVRFR